MFFKDGQIVLDFIHNKIIVWDKSHSIDTSRCRLATEYEIKLYKKIGKKTVKFSEINTLPVSERMFIYTLPGGGQKKWKLRDNVVIPFNLTKSNIYHLEEIKDKAKLGNHQEALTVALQNFDLSEMQKLQKESTDKYEIYIEIRDLLQKLNKTNEKLLY